MTPPIHLSHNKWPIKGKCNMCHICSAEMDSEQAWYKRVREVAIKAATKAKESLGIWAAVFWHGSPAPVASKVF